MQANPIDQQLSDLIDAYGIRAVLLELAYQCGQRREHYYGRAKSVKKTNQELWLELFTTGDVWDNVRFELEQLIENWNMPS